MKNINLVCDQVNSWSTKVVNKLNKQLLEDKGQQIEDVDNMSLSIVFQNITEVVCDKLQETIQANKEQRERDMAAGIYNEDGCNEDFDHQFMDFATDEFISKNIRVRPASGATEPGTREDRSEIQMKHGYDDQNEDEKHNQAVVFEMEMQRKEVKQKKELYERAM